MGAKQYHDHDAWIHVLCKIEVSTAWDESKTARAQGKECKSTL
jgi:hypothetical protein